LNEKSKQDRRAIYEAKEMGLDHESMNDDTERDGHERRGAGASKGNIVSKAEGANGQKQPVEPGFRILLQNEIGEGKYCQRGKRS